LEWCTLSPKREIGAQKEVRKKPGAKQEETFLKAIIKSQAKNWLIPPPLLCLQ